MAAAKRYGPASLGLIALVVGVWIFVSRGGAAATSAGEKAIKDHMVMLSAPSMNVLPIKDPRRPNLLLQASKPPRGAVLGASVLPSRVYEASMLPEAYSSSGSGRE